MVWAYLWASPALRPLALVAFFQGAELLRISAPSLATERGFPTAIRRIKCPFYCSFLPSFCSDVFSASRLHLILLFSEGPGVVQKEALIECVPR